MTQEKLIFAIIKDEYLGYIIEAYIVEINPQGNFYLSYHKAKKGNLPQNFQITSSETNVLQLIENYSYEHLMKKFSKMYGVKAQEFISKLNVELFQNHIRPYIEKNIFKIIRTINEDHLSFHFKGLAKDIINEKPISIHQQTDVKFCFTKHENGINYQLMLFENNESIEINSKAVILTNTPCILYNNNSLYLIYSVDGKKINTFINKKYVEIPKKNEIEYFKTFIFQTIKNNYNVAPIGFNVIKTDNKPNTLFYFEKDWQNIDVLTLKFLYNNQHECYFHDLDQSFVELKLENEDITYYKTKRNKEFENDILQILRQNNLIVKDGSGLYIKNDINTVCNEIDNQENIKNYFYKLHEWINNNDELLKGLNINIIQKGNTKYNFNKVDVKIATYAKNDWFDLEIIIHIGDIHLTLSEISKNLLNNKREYLLSSGEIFIIPEEWFAKFKDLAYLSQNNGGKTFIHKSYYKLIENIQDDNTALADKNIINKDINEYKLEISPEIKAILRPYQLEGIEWLRFLNVNNFGGCLADDMGLGKTLQILAFLNSLKENKILPNRELKVNKQIKNNLQFSLFKTAENKDITISNTITSLIVMPLSLIHNWENEILKFTPNLKYYIYTGNQKNNDINNFENYDIILTTYGILRNNIDLIKYFNFYYVILDESQAIKNSESVSYKSVKELSSDHIISVTGTPIENSLSDLWSQFSILNPGLLLNLAKFKDYFLNPIEKLKDKEKESLLKKIIEPYILRRTKEKVAKDLPALTEKIYFCEMGEEEKANYERKKSEIRNFILESIEQNNSKKHLIILKGLMQLRLLANNHLLTQEKLDITSTKFNEVIENINVLLEENHKILIFSSFVKHLNIFADYFRENNISFEMLTGSNKESERKNIINNFKNNCSVFLISIKAGGTGLNLTEADYVFLLDPWWNPAVENQAIARAHRIGQTEHVFAYKFITKGTIEEKIIKLQNTKKDLANTFINNKVMENFSTEELIKLFE